MNIKEIFKKIVVYTLKMESKFVLRKYRPKIVAVTGSVGKTTAKDAIYSVLADSFYTRKSEKSFNSEIGIPLTILGCNSGWSNPFIWIKNFLEGVRLFVLKNRYPDWLVLEVGVDRPGDIESLNKWLNIDIVVITRFAKVPVHVEFFESPEALIAEKKKLLLNLKADGSLILNYDDSDVISLRKDFKGRVLSFGLNDGADVRASNIEVFYEEEVPAGILFKVNYMGNSVPVKIYGVLGRQHIYPVLSAISVGITQGINIVSASQSLSNKYERQPGRMKLIRGLKKTLIIDDSYNSSPVAVEGALETLRDLNSKGKKIAVLGDMLELGKFSIEEHRKVGKIVAEVCDTLVTVGLRARDIADGALTGGLSEKNILQFEGSKEAGAYLQNIINEGDIILVKGSQSMRTEKVVEEIMENPENKKQLLVRQEDEWLVR